MGEISAKPELTCTISISFSAAKRLRGVSGKCNWLHGYRHTIEATFVSADATAGLVADFYQLERALGAWVDANWDHTILLHESDRELGAAISAITGQGVYYLRHDPIAEYLAQHLLHEVIPEIISDVRCAKIRLYDTPHHYVEYRI